MQSKTSDGSGLEKRPFAMDVKDDNPYSRLMALKRMGVVPNYEDIRNKSVAIIGVGGVGSVVAEMLTRCGIGKLLLFDYDTVELANMNRLFFRPDQAGMSKVEAAKQTLEGINPDVTVVPCTNNITHSDKYDEFVLDLTKRGGVKEGTGIDVLLCCVDNFQARLTVNLVCLEHNIPWLESGVAENAVSGHIQLLLPGVTPCYECCPPLVVANGMSETKREGVCAASLPTTIGIVAGILSQNCLKYLLEFGTVSEYVGYDAMKDHFPEITLKPNKDCRNNLCKKRQQEYLNKRADLGEAAHPLYDRLMKQKEAERVTITEGKKKAAATAAEWGIEVTEEGKDFQLGLKGKATSDQEVGVEYEYSLGDQEKANVYEEPALPTEGKSLEHLMAELSSLQE